MFENIFTLNNNLYSHKILNNNGNGSELHYGCFSFIVCISISILFSITTTNCKNYMVVIACMFCICIFFMYILKKTRRIEENTKCICL